MPKKQEALIKEIQEKELKSNLRKQLKKEGNLIPNPELTIPEEDVKKLKAQGLWDVITKGLKMLPPVAAGIVYAEQKQAGASTGEAIAYGASEFLPISASDVDMAAAFAREAREKGLPEALGIDTEKTQAMNVIRKRRLADRVRQNTSVTPPPQEGFINRNQMGE